MTPEEEAFLYDNPIASLDDLIVQNNNMQENLNDLEAEVKRLKSKEGTQKALKEEYKRAAYDLLAENKRLQSALECQYAQVEGHVAENEAWAEKWMAERAYSNALRETLKQELKVARDDGWTDAALLEEKGE